MGMNMDKLSDSQPTDHNSYGSPAPAPQNTVRRAFEPGIQAPDGTFVFIKNPADDDLLPIYEMLLKEISQDVAPFEVVKSVYGHNPMSFWGVYRSADEHRRFPKLVGFVSYLPLNAAGRAALENKTLNGRDPDLAHLAKPGEDPVMLYLWAMVSPGLGNIVFMLNARAIGADLFERLAGRRMDFDRGGADLAEAVLEDARAICRRDDRIDFRDQLSAKIL